MDPLQLTLAMARVVHDQKRELMSYLRLYMVKFIALVREAAGSCGNLHHGATPMHAGTHAECKRTNSHAATRCGPCSVGGGPCVSCTAFSDVSPAYAKAERCM